MKLFSLFVFARGLIKDTANNPDNLRLYAKHHQFLRSLAISEGLLPVRDIFDYVPDAGSVQIRMENIFERPLFPVGLKKERENYLSCTSLADTYALLLLAKSLEPHLDHILEIGTADGTTALQFAINTSAAITTLDIQSDNPTIGMRFRHHPVGSRVKPVVSTLGALPASSHRFDFIFIDGGHGYQDVKDDTKRALDLIRPGGIIAWHDYSFPFRYDVVRALDELRLTGLDIAKLAYTNLAVLRV